MVRALSLIVEERQDFGDETAVEAPGTGWCPGTQPGPRLPSWLWMDKDSKGSPRRDGVPLEPSGASVSHSTERATEQGAALAEGRIQSRCGEQGEQLRPKPSCTTGLLFQVCPPEARRGCCAPHAQSKDPWVMGRGSRRGCPWVFKEDQTPPEAQQRGSRNGS